MDINFTGIRNIYGMRVSIKKIVPPDEVRATSEKTYLAMQLTNDLDGNDFTEFINTARTTDLKNIYHPIHPDFLNITASKYTDMTKAIETNSYKLFINNIHPVNINDKNLKFFTYLAKLLKKVQQKPEEDFVVSNNFVFGPTVQNTLILGNDPAPDTRLFLSQLFSPVNVKLQAEKINSLLNKIMCSYFDVR